MDISRRRVLQLLGLSSLALTVKPVFNAFAKEAAQAENTAAIIKRSPDALAAKQWAMVIDTRKFETEEELKPLVEACHKIHNVPHFEIKRHEIKWIWGVPYHNAFPGKAARFLSEEVEQKPFLVLCNHCENPPCESVCPTGATYINEDGLVLVDYDKCIGCKTCMTACPYNIRWYIDKEEYYFPNTPIPYGVDELRGYEKIVQKCNFCVDRLKRGEEPKCVEVCPTYCRKFGDMEDPQSEVAQIARGERTFVLRPQAGTEPRVRYIQNKNLDIVKIR